ncbi:MAG TPA: HD domain-containing phosphohydrolase, partial [Trueperaceae bacterium]|nr:HD domain-containing phosphohydrolase [Trueperaceae bacterium]
MTLKPNPDIIAPTIRIDRRLEKKRARSVGTVPEIRSDFGTTFLLSELMAGLSHALDVSEGHDQEHALRACVIGMRVGQRLSLDSASMSDLFYALLLKDIGASSNAAQIHYIFGRDDDQVRRALRRVDFGRLDEGARFMVWQLGGSVKLSRRLRYLFELGLGRFHGTGQLIKTRADRGAQLVDEMGFGPQVATAIHAASERHDGSGGPRGLAGDEIPLLARIVSLAQTAEQYFAEGGVPAVSKLLSTRAGSWFDPVVASALSQLLTLPSFWDDLERDSVWHALTEAAPQGPPAVGQFA